MGSFGGYPVYPFFAILSTVLVLIPLPWHLQSWNTGTCMYMIWAALGCLNGAINAIVWHDNALNPSPVWCDISSHFIISLSFSIPACSLTIMRRLYLISRLSTTAPAAPRPLTVKLPFRKPITVFTNPKSMAVAVDLSITLGAPLLLTALSYIVQGHRYNIFEDAGCQPAIYNTPVTYVLVFIWPIVFGLVSSVYGVLTLMTFMRHRSSFASFLHSRHNIQMGRYVRLMALACMDVLFTVPFAIFTMANDTKIGAHPYINWENVHFDFSDVDQIARVQWMSSKSLRIGVFFTQWSIVACALTFFAFFGFAEEARKQYNRAYWAVSTRLGYELPAKTGTSAMHSSAMPSKFALGSTTSKGATLPVYAPDSLGRSTKKRQSSHLSLSSFGDLEASYATYDTYDEKNAEPKYIPYSASEKQGDDDRSTSRASTLPPSPSDELAGLPHLARLSGTPQPPALTLTVPSPVFIREPRRPDAPSDAESRPTSMMIEVSSVRRPSLPDETGPNMV